MGVREKLEGYPRLATGAAGAVVLGLVIVIGSEWRSMAASGMPKGIASFYSTDDGKTWFSQTTTDLPPIDTPNGPADQAGVYQCDGKQFVAYLVRFTPEAKKAMDEYQKKSAASSHVPGPPPHWIFQTGEKVKRPGDAKWMNASSPQAQRLLERPSSPTGSGTPIMVTP